MDQEKVMTFQAFAQKAARKIEERKKRKRKSLYIGALEEKIEIQGLMDQEIVDCNEYSDNEQTNDKYTMYYASPTLQDLAKYMKEKPMIQDYLEVCECIDLKDRNKIVNEILELSGVLGESTVKELDEIKK